MLLAEMATLTSQVRARGQVDSVSMWPYSDAPNMHCSFDGTTQLARVRPRCHSTSFWTSFSGCVLMIQSQLCGCVSDDLLLSRRAERNVLSIWLLPSNCASLDHYCSIPCCFVWKVVRNILDDAASTCWHQNALTANAKLLHKAIYYHRDLSFTI